MRLNVKLSLRRRVALGIATLGILIVTAHSVALYLVTRDQEEELIAQILTEEMDHLIAAHARDPGAPPPRIRNLNGYLVATERARAELPPYLRELPLGDHDLRVRDVTLRVAVRAVGATRFYIAYDATHHEDRMRQLVWLLLLGVVATAALAAGLGYWLSELLTQPVSDLAARVGALGPGRPEAPLADRYADEEVKRLAQAFDGYLRKVADLIEREQEFTANVSHELRTPLTAIQTSCELLAQDPRLDAAARGRLDMIRRAAARMSELTRALLFLARGEQAAEVEDVSVHACVAEVAELLRDALAQRGLALEIAVDPPAVLRVDRNALFLTLANLLKNAVEHTERGSIRVRYRNRRLEIEDSGRGIREEELPRIFQRFYRGAAGAGEGFGLGLAIVKRICDRYGWRLAVESRLGTGTRVTVSFADGGFSQNLHAAATEN